MDLYILRHAIAEDILDPAKDAERRLTREGRDKMRGIAEGMKAEELLFDLILSSPYLRAKETAEIVAEVFGKQKKLKFSDTLKPDGSPKDLIDELRGQHGKSQSVVLVGHEPYLSRLISLLIAGDTRAGITLKKGGLAKISTEHLAFGACAKLEWLLQPGQARRLGKSA